MRLEQYIRKAANEDVYLGIGYAVPRTDIGVLIRYCYLWLSLPLWGPFILFLDALSSLGRRLQ